MLDHAVIIKVFRKILSCHPVMFYLIRLPHSFSNVGYNNPWILILLNETFIRNLPNLFLKLYNKISYANSLFRFQYGSTQGPTNRYEFFLKGVIVVF